MPTLPTRDSLGQTPVPVSRRGISSNPAAGVVGSAMEGFGQTVSGIGKGMIEKEDRLSYAAAKANLLKADITARQELANDPDHETWDARYKAKMKSAKELAGTSIKSRSDRAMFDTDADIDVLRGSAELEKGANVKRSVARVAILDEGMATAQDSYINAPDAATAEAVLNNTNELLSAAVVRGDIDPVTAGNRRRNFAQTAIVQKTEAMKLAGDLDGAEKFFEASRDKLDANTEMQLGAQIKGAKDDRFVLVKAEEFVHSAPLKSGESVPEVVGPEQSAIRAAADELGVTPIELAAIAHYESAGTMKPSIKGGDGGRYQGIFQFGPEEQAKYGVNSSSSFMDQTAALVRFARDRGFKRGMGWEKLYTTINAGNPHAPVGAADSNGTQSEHYAKIRKKSMAAGQAFVGGAQQGPEEHDLNAIMANVDATADKEKWTPEMREAVKAQAARVVQRDEALLGRKQKVADESAAGVVIKLGDDFTDIAMIPIATRKDMSPVELARYQDRARENKIAKNTIKDDTLPSLYMQRLQREDPDLFANADIGSLAGKVSTKDIQQLWLQQGSARKGMVEQNGKWVRVEPLQTRAPGITAAIGRSKYYGIELKDKDMPAVFDTMDAYLAEKAKKGPLQPTDYDEALKYAAAPRITMRQSGWFGDTVTKEAPYQLTIDTVSDASKAKIRNNWRGPKPPTDAEIVRAARLLHGTD